MKKLFDGLFLSFSASMLVFFFGLSAVPAAFCQDSQDESVSENADPADDGNERGEEEKQADAGQEQNVEEPAVGLDSGSAQNQDAEPPSGDVAGSTDTQKSNVPAGRSYFNPSSRMDPMLSYYELQLIKVEDKKEEERRKEAAYLLTHRELPKDETKKKDQPADPKRYFRCSAAFVPNSALINGKLFGINTTIPALSKKIGPAVLKKVFTRKDLYYATIAFDGKLYNLKCN